MPFPILSDVDAARIAAAAIYAITDNDGSDTANFRPLRQGVGDQSNVDQVTGIKLVDFAAGDASALSGILAFLGKKLNSVATQWWAHNENNRPMPPGTIPDPMVTDTLDQVFASVIIWGGLG